MLILTLSLCKVTELVSVRRTVSTISAVVEYVERAVITELRRTYTLDSPVEKSVHGL